MDNFDHKCVFALVIMVADHYYYQHQTISSASLSLVSRYEIWSSAFQIITFIRHGYQTRSGR